MVVFANNVKIALRQKMVDIGHAPCDGILYWQHGQFGLVVLHGGENILERKAGQGFMRRRASAAGEIGIGAFGALKSDVFFHVMWMRCFWGFVKALGWLIVFFAILALPQGHGDFFRKERFMIRLASILGLLGLVGATGVIVYSGYDQVLLALQQAGWGIVWTSLYHLVPMFLCVIGWQAVLAGRGRPGYMYFMYLLWIRAAINNLMPVARIGGEVVAVRLMMKNGIRKAPAVACMVVETTLSVIAQFVFVLLGVALFALHVSDKNIMAQLSFGLFFSLIAILALVFVQRVGFFGLVHQLFTLLFNDKWRKFAGNTALLDRAIRTMYRRTGRSLLCGVMQFLSWVAGGVEIWLALYFLGHPIGILESMMIEALIQATWAAAFIVPGALGVQEAGFLLFGSLLGLTPEVAAALAVIRRCRDLLLYVPGLIVWQVQEGRWMLKKHRKEAAA